MTISPPSAEDEGYARALKIAAVVNLAAFAGEVLVAIQSGSVALMAMPSIFLRMRCFMRWRFSPSVPRSARGR